MLNTKNPLYSTTDLQELTKRYSGKLLLRQEIDMTQDEFSSAIKHQLFSETPPFKSKSFFYQCQRCGNNKKYYLGTIPCAVCQKNHYYCRKCVEMGRVMTCTPLYIWNGPEANWEMHENPCTWSGELTSVQEKASKRMVEAIQNREKVLLIWAVCGAGKTEMLFPGITEALKMGKRICLATPRADVVRELFPRFKEAFQDVSIQALYGGSPDKAGNAQLILATTHQLIRYQEAFDLMIIDEVDAFPFHMDPSLPFAANRAKKTTSTTIYLTATPRKIHRKLVEQKKIPHVFVPIRYHGFPLPVPTLTLCFSLKKQLKLNQYPTPFLKWYQKRKNPSRQLLIFVSTIDLAQNLKKSHDFQLKVESVHAEDPEREEKVQLFRKKKIDILLTTTILERGVTFPSVDVAVIDASHDVFDEAALVQIAGRAGRNSNDPTGEVVFFHDGKTNAMVQAIRSIQKMNKRGEALK
ncbi:DEAD/DEAH box helicase [Ornithinibacillus halophilus]|uniref:Competence protein ComFA n=1 Tax=Ornithinibacillus halophilus TaxID=930117 RepID=A0A1M5FCZ9_9BACI|nr:DEAD/DEAH box helicase family protein [Ornithinibacillus halophilus]SHF89359.1 competence protein ComFA [Ornithinibacillus halophilus]